MDVTTKLLNVFASKKHCPTNVLALIQYQRDNTYEELEAPAKTSGKAKGKRKLDTQSDASAFTHIAF